MNYNPHNAIERVQSEDKRFKSSYVISGRNKSKTNSERAHLKETQALSRPQLCEYSYLRVSSLNNRQEKFSQL